MTQVIGDGFNRPKILLYGALKTREVSSQDVLASKHYEKMTLMVCNTSLGQECALLKVLMYKSAHM